MNIYVRYLSTFRHILDPNIQRVLFDQILILPDQIFVVA